MTKENQVEFDLKQRLMTSAAELGRQMLAESESDAKHAKNASVAVKEAKDGARDAGRTIAGFNTPMFRGLATLGGLWASDNTIAVDRDSPLAQSVATGMAASFMAAFTNATAATDKGGTSSGYVAVIRCGRGAERLRTAIANRLDYWLAKLDSVAGLNDEDSKAIRVEAQQYTVQPGPSLDASGNWPTRDDKPYAPKFNGRKACTVNGIDLPHRGATDRKAMLAAAARLYLERGDAVLHTDVIDAILDNGGRYEVPKDESVKGLASAAREAINKVLLAGGNASADAVALMMAAQTLGAIADNGLTESVTAASINPALVVTPAPTPAPIPTAPDESADSNPSDSDTAPTQGDPIVLGAAPAGGKRRAKKQGGGL